VNETGASGTGNKWEGCRLQRTLLTPEMVYSAPLVQGDRQNYIHGLSPSDKDLLFGGLPYTTLSLASTTPGGAGENGITEQENQVESIRRILDLRNASRSGIEVVNRQRIVEEFGRKRVLRQQDGGEGEWGYEGEPQSGGSEVQGMSLLPFLPFLVLLPLLQLRTPTYFTLWSILSGSDLDRDAYWANMAWIMRISDIKSRGLSIPLPSQTPILSLLDLIFPSSLFRALALDPHTHIQTTTRARLALLAPRLPSLRSPLLLPSLRSG